MFIEIILSFLGRAHDWFFLLYKLLSFGQPILEVRHFLGNSGVRPCSLLASCQLMSQSLSQVIVTALQGTVRGKQ